MRILHTSDWHLGRLFHGVHLTEDQAHVLDQLVNLCEDVKPDVLLVAGDVFDRAVPPPEAVELLDDVLGRLVLGLKLPVIMIAGNHDSPVRLGFSSKVLARSGLHVCACPVGEAVPIILEDEHGPVAVYPLPYAEPAVVRECLPGETPQDHHCAMEVRLRRMAPPAPAVRRRVLLAHEFVTGGTASDSERPLTIGGAGMVESSVFDGFDFVALGHLHRPQNVPTPRLHYSGSLMKYSFSEINDTKSVTLVEMNETGEVTLERVPLTPRRDLRKIEGRLKDLLHGPGDGTGQEDYLLVTLLDEGAVLDAMGRLRDVYPNVLHIERPFLGVGQGRRPAAADHRRLTEFDLFRSFFSHVMGEDMTRDQQDMLAGIIETWQRAEREVGQ